MVDLAKCTGENCPYKENCFRYTSNASSFQTYIASVPIKDDSCEYFINATPELDKA